jgi:hypothetical protein
MDHALLPCDLCASERGTQLMKPSLVYINPLLSEGFKQFILDYMPRTGRERSFSPGWRGV